MHVKMLKQIYLAFISLLGTRKHRKIIIKSRLGMKKFSSALTSSIKFSTVNSRFKKDLKLQIHLHKAFFSDDRFLDSLHKSFLNQTTLDLRKEKWTFLNREFTVLTYFVALTMVPRKNIELSCL